MPKFVAASLLTLTAVAGAATGCASESEVRDAIGSKLPSPDAGTGGFVSGTGGAGAGTGGATSSGTGGTGTGGTPSGTGGTAASSGGSPSAGGTTGSGGAAGSGGGSDECDPAYCPRDSFGTPCCVEATGECGVDMGMGCVQTMPSDGVDGG